MRENLPVSAEFFSGALKLLTKEHGNRVVSPIMSDIRDALAEIEMLYKSQPVFEKPAKSKTNV